MSEKKLNSFKRSATQVDTQIERVSKVLPRESPIIHRNDDDDHDEVEDNQVSEINKKKECSAPTTTRKSSSQEWRREFVGK